MNALIDGNVCAARLEVKSLALFVARAYDGSLPVARGQHKERPRVAHAPQNPAERECVGVRKASRPRTRVRRFRAKLLPARCVGQIIRAHTTEQ
jgi:hypothetical protein